MGRIIRSDPAYRSEAGGGSSAMIQGPMQTSTVKKGETLELVLDSAGFEGVAVGRVEGFVVFVRGGVPGDRVRALVRKKQRNFAEASLEEVLEPSPSRVEPRCRYFGVCGGCRWQNAEYSLQLEFKREQVGDLLRRIGGFSDAQVRPTLESPEPYFYRNKMEFTFGSSRWLMAEEIAAGGEADREFALGLHVPKRFDKILDLHECHLQSELSVRIVNWTRNWTRSQGWSPYDTRANRGFLRNLVIRQGRRTGETMVNLVTGAGPFDRLEAFRDAIVAEFPEITTVVHSLNPGRSPVAAGSERVLHGSGTITERISGLTFRVAPTTFFQPNTLQAERLYAVVRELAEARPGETLLDVFCGIGCIGLTMAREAAFVVGVEQQAEAVEEARRNASANGIENAAFYARDAEGAFDPEILERHGRPSVVVVDPPRVGLAPALCQALLAASPARIVYVSCNPATQARDLAVLSEGYEVAAVQPVDMFPQTYHVENVVLLVSRQP